MNAVLEFEGLPSLSLQYCRALARVGRPHFSGTLPDLHAVAKGVTIDPARLAAYRAVCSLPSGPTLPATYPQVLASPLHGAILAHRAFPFQPLGIVHRASLIRVHEAIDSRQPLDLRAYIGDCRDVERGLEFDLETVATIEARQVWQSTTTILVRLGKAAKTTTEKRHELPGDPPGRSRSVVLSVPEDMGRRYGHVSGDYNPIHLHALLARPFGFARAIVQGMWSLARCLGEMADEMPTAPYRIEASFDRPILLPARVLFVSGQTEQGLEFALKKVDGSKPYVQGSCRREG